MQHGKGLDALWQTPYLHTSPTTQTQAHRRMLKARKENDVMDIVEVKIEAVSDDERDDQEPPSKRARSSSPIRPTSGSTKRSSPDTPPDSTTHTKRQRVEHPASADFIRGRDCEADEAAALGGDLPSFHLGGRHNFCATCFGRIVSNHRRR